MRELSLHIMDIVENGLSAGADLIQVSVAEDRKEKRLRIAVKDNGRGIPQDLLQRVLSPFYTTRTTRRVGLGLSLFREAARRCEGEFHLASKEGEGTEALATFRLDHIDLAPLGDMAGSLTSFIMGRPDVDFVYTHELDGKVFRMDTREVKKELDGLPINNPKVIRHLAAFIRESVADLKAGADGSAAP
ncbi:MAG: ATP-binding protein [Desulfobacterales bacterium]|nr:ATP-binding protein [Desulfobacterales bacterium]